MYFFTQMECLRFLPIANKFAAAKLDAIAAVQAATIISFSPDIVTFAVLFKEVGFMGQPHYVTSVSNFVSGWLGPV